MDRSFLLRAPPPCRLPLFDGVLVDRIDVFASIFGARIASSECVRLTSDARAYDLSNGFACDAHDRSTSRAIFCAAMRSMIVDEVGKRGRDVVAERAARAARMRSARRLAQVQPRAAIGVTGRCATPV
jgi:hypothetical protein